jgi:hypothetical protein
VRRFWAYHAVVIADFYSPTLKQILLIVSGDISPSYSVQLPFF